MLSSRQQMLDAQRMEAALLGTLRTTLQRGHSESRQRFQQDIPVEQLVSARASLVDALLQQLWQHFFGSDVADLALVAVGGYGRGELHPHSDIDLMILGGAQALDAQRTNVESFLTALWDIGLEVGHSVRTIEDCVHQGAADLTVATSLMEARRLSGSAQLFEQMRMATGPERIWSVTDFFEAKQQERYQRCRRYNQTAFTLEPNIKEGPGGLRDVQMIGWVAKRHFAAATLSELVGHGFLSAGEYAELIEHRNFLWQIRFALHYLAGRRHEILLFDYQRQLAQQFGYQDADDNLAVEQFMQRYYRTISALVQLNEMLLQLFAEAILCADESNATIPINCRFQARCGYLEVVKPRIFLHYPPALLEVFLVLQRYPELKGIRAATIRLIREHVVLINDQFRADQRVRRLFLEILSQPYGVTQQLRLMLAYGVLPAYLPEFSKIVGRMQYDLFHAYTVDQHTLFVVRNLRRFTLREFTEQTPRCSALMARLPKPELLYIAAIYHDIAKGRSGDHSNLGAVDAERFCRNHGLSTFDTQLVVWLVRHHLLFSLTAQKQDINDAEIIHKFAQQMGDLMHLDYLYLLTVADIRATNPNLWNSWRESLLWQLYEYTSQALRSGLEPPLERAQRIKTVQEKARQKLLRARMDGRHIAEIWAGFSDDYFLRHSVDEIAWHTRVILKRGSIQQPLVMARHNAERGGTDIFIYTRDRNNLFALITATLDKLQLTVLDARIITGHNGYALDSFTVLEDSGLAICERQRIKAITTTLTRILEQPDARPVIASRYISRMQKAFWIPTCVSFYEDTVNNRTIVELISWDRPGLLSHIGQAFMAYGVKLHNAKIMTVGARVEDVFFITDCDNQPLNDAGKYMALQAILVEQLDAKRRI